MYADSPKMQSTDLLIDAPRNRMGTLESYGDRVVPLIVASFYDSKALGFLILGSNCNAGEGRMTTSIDQEYSYGATLRLTMPVVDGPIKAAK